MTQTFYMGDPASTDQMWNMEQESVIDFCHGRGLDPGAGNRTLYDTTIRADLFADLSPHVRASASKLPFKSHTFDYVVNSHLLEHLADPRAAIVEWLRVVKPGGHVAVIVPDTRWTGGMNTDRTPHLFEWSPDDFQDQVLGWGWSPRWYECHGPIEWADAEVVHMAEACPGWSFNCVLRKGGGEVVEQCAP